MHNHSTTSIFRSDLMFSSNLNIHEHDHMSITSLDGVETAKNRVRKAVSRYKNTKYNFTQITLQIIIYRTLLNVLSSTLNYKNYLSLEKLVDIIEYVKKRC
ncbi:hypothetical protein ACJX0J_014539, partial [Zea mays]